MCMQFSGKRQNEIYEIAKQATNTDDDDDDDG